MQLLNLNNVGHSDLFFHGPVIMTLKYYFMDNYLSHRGTTLDQKCRS